MSASTADPFALMAGFVLEDGRCWGEVAYDWQREDAEAVIDRDGPRRHFWLRARGRSKTGDAAATALSLLLTEAPPRSRSHAYAVDADQAAILTDAIAGYVMRTPKLAGAVELGARGVTVRSTGASLVVESSDGASAFGLKPWMTLVDEFAMWPSTTRHRQLWSAIASAVPKVRDGRLLVFTTAGSPSGIGAHVWGEAERSTHWRTAKRPGPSPWWSPEDIAELRSSLTAAEWRRLIDCEFAEGDDALTSPEDVEAVIRRSPLVLPPQIGTPYVAALDLGTRRDLTAFAIGHSAQREGGRMTIVDRLVYWRPGKGKQGRVDLAEVEETVKRLSREYRVGAVRYDRHQAEQLTQGLERAGVPVEEFVFSASSVNNLARSLHIGLRDRALELPDDQELREQFIATRLVETNAGVRLNNPVGQHDDIPTVTAMLHVALAEKASVGRAAITVPRATVPIKRATRTAEPGELARSVALRALRQGGDRSSRLGSALFDRRRGAR